MTYGITVDTPMRNDVEGKLKTVHVRMRSCRKCENVCGGAVTGPAMETSIMIIGQAPGIHEGHLGRPFAFTAGKTLFKWLEQSTGANEETVRELVYFSAVARCFPGKAKSGSGDRVPSPIEIENCRVNLKDEIQALKPKLILAVGRLAISETLKDKFAKTDTLEKVVGKKFTINLYGETVNVIPLPHPSGVSRWPQTEPGKTKLKHALNLISKEFKILL